MTGTLARRFWAGVVRVGAEAGGIGAEAGAVRGGVYAGRCNGFPDFRIQKQDYYTKRYKDMYLCDNGMQFTTAIEDFEYTKWLDPEGVPCYVKEKGSRHLSSVGRAGH